MKKTVSILLALGLSLVVTFAVFADTNTIYSDTNVMVYDVLNEYKPLNDAAWVNPEPAVVTWKHSAWPTLDPAFWISDSYYIGGNVSANSWRRFSKTVELCEGAYNISGTVNATADNAEEAYVNGVLIGSDGEVTGAFVDNQEWSTIKEYIYVAHADTLTFDFIVRNYAGQNSPTANPTGLIFNATITYECNVPPTADPNGPYLGAVNTSIAFDGSGSSDPDNDPLTYAWTFGDGSTGTGATPSHLYTTAGIHEVCLTVNDGVVDSTAVCTHAVVYDPTGGFVTGGGWIDSAPGAYLSDPTLGGKATFGFVSKYKRGATVPDGNTEFQFRAGNLNFSSTSYEWLVVNQDGTNAQFKGYGTINGAGNYGFMLWAGDGAPDTFRIKIWDAGTEDEVVVYDNGMAQAISGGSIVVHKR